MRTRPFERTDNKPKRPRGKLKPIPENSGSITRQQLALYLGVSVQQIDQMDSLPRFKVGRFVRFRRIEVEHWIDEAKKTAAAELAGKLRAQAETARRDREGR